MRRREDLKTWMALCVSVLVMAQTVAARTAYVDANAPRPLHGPNSL
jgi:hypothetical protein